MLQSRVFKVVILLFSISITLWYLNLKSSRIEEADWTFTIQKIRENLYLFLLILFLIPINWTIEAIKWKKSIDGHLKISIYDSFKGVLGGVFLNLFSPFGLGDYLSKSLVVSNLKDFKLHEYTFIANGTQWLIGFQICGIYLGNYLNNFNGNCLIFLVVLISIFAIIIGLLNERIFEKFNSMKPGPKLLPSKTIFELYLLSLIRFGVFVFQFFLMFKIFGLNLQNSKIIEGIIIILSSKIILPFLNLFLDLSLRDWVAVQYFKNYQVDLQLISIISALIWLINIGIPALIGSFMVVYFKFKK